MIEIPASHHVISFFTNEDVGTEILHTEEQKVAIHYESKRLLDFCRGRYCAHQCLKQVGMTSPILKETSGAPKWPIGMTGSISHSQHLAGAILASHQIYQTIGLDIETIGRVQPDLWDLFFTSDEIKLLSSANNAESEFLSTLFFSMKETFYKMQYQLTKSFIDFHDCEVILSGNEYYIKPLIQMPKTMSNGSHYKMDFQRWKNEVICYSMIEHEGHRPEINQA
ncbi:4'-phosphopantetheinyl transferase superfamily protein [Reichenbachiella agarivorans]|uniref:Enterobactin synthase component D n=1 Tax=Reichenbachiella agarivorans TaxID=2979464 RepID=A0ABY6CU90_9BACT|nr:4'-phosphopantetheinyl transferase superfamily protein [Reichenbachiella agarivorans]UXP34081.1 4'-phosphopantetheinyl transferase superfamily protein [Reichenbachiella agarivorans]